MSFEKDWDETQFRIERVFRWTRRSNLPVLFIFGQNLDDACCMVWNKSPKYVPALCCWRWFWERASERNLFYRSKAPNWNSLFFSYSLFFLILQQFCETHLLRNTSACESWKKDETMDPKTNVLFFSLLEKIKTRHMRKPENNCTHL